MKDVKEKTTKLTLKQFKTDADWFNFGDKVNQRWRELMNLNTKYGQSAAGRYPNPQAMNVLSKEFNASIKVIRKAIHRYSYSNELIGDEI